MFHKITDLEGISANHARTLEKAEITTTEHLLTKAHEPKARGRLAVQTGIGEKYLNRWVAMADLMRIRGVSHQYGVLLMAVGVESTHELLTMNPKELVRLMEEHKRATKLASSAPKLADVEQWLTEVRTPGFAQGN